jgi:hypothetical protein
LSKDKSFAIATRSIKTSKIHLKLLKIIFTPNELAFGLVEKTSSERPLLDGDKLNLLKGSFFLF